MGASFQETEELSKLANEKGVITAIGLQGHHAPEFIYMKQLVEDGWFGQVVSVKMTMQTKASSVRASRNAWEEEKQRKATLFSIVGGHTLYYLSNIFGSITELAGQLTTQIKQLTLKDSGEIVDNDIVDQISIHGLLNDEIPFQSQISALPHHSNGWRMDIYGTEGTLVATSAMLPQITPIKIMGSKNDSEFKKMSIPSEFVKFDYLPEGPSGNVGRNYGSMVASIINKEEFHPNFDDALKMHSLLETIKRSSIEKRTIKTLYNN